MTEGRKDDMKDGKLRWDLLPLDLIEKIVEVYHFGAQKYAPNTWKQLEDGENRYRGALLRHLVEHEKGNLRDDESGLLHAQHLCWNAIALLYFAIEKEKHESPVSVVTQEEMENRLFGCDEMRYTKP